MFGLNYQKPHWGPIGLDLNRDCIRMVQLCTTREGLVIAAAHERKVHSSDEQGDLHARWRSTLQRMLEEYDFRGKRVVVGCPPDLLKITPVRFNESEDEQGCMEMQRQAAWRLGWDPELYTIESIPAGRVTQQDQAKVEVILMAAENQGIRALLEQLDEVGVEVVGLDPIPCAVFRNAQRSMKRKGEPDQLTVFVDVGRGFTHVVFGRDETISFIKQIPLGTEHFLREITQKLGIDTLQAELLRAKAYQPCSDHDSDDTSEGVILERGIRQAVMDADTTISEELCREMGLCLRYYTVTFRGQRVHRVVFSGGEGEEGILQSTIGRVMHVPVQSIDPFEGLISSRQHLPCSVKEHSRPWAVATGLALKGWLTTDESCEILTGSTQKSLVTI